MILLAHDGSIYSEWVARYASRLAEQESDRKLLVLNVDDGKLSREVVEVRLKKLRDACQAVDIDCSVTILPLGTTVHRALRQAVPHDPDALLICGTRIKPKKNSYISGTIAEKLLRMHQCPVLAIRVVQPGLLGSPRDLLLPLAGHLDGINRVWPVLSRFAPQTNYIRLFRAIQVHPLRHPYLTPSRELRLRELGEQHLTEISAELRRRLPVAPFRLEHRVSISTDWVNDALVQASRLKVEMILLGISERNLAHRVLYGDEIEMILRDTPCDVGVYRGP